MDYRQHIASVLAARGLDSEQELISSVVTPPNPEMGDYALPCFKYAKVLRKSPMAIAAELATAFEGDSVITSCEVQGGYLNFRVSKEKFCEETVREILEKGMAYGSSDLGAGKTVCIDYSSVNIAKPFHIGHLSTTVIGAALYRIFGFLGYRTVGINHLGDWGTQFGKLIVAYHKWGDRETIDRGGIRALLDIYVRFHAEAEKDPTLDDEARNWFKRIEDGDKEALALFDWFKEVTLREVNRLYDRLNIKFDSYNGESFYNDKMQPVLDKIEQKGLLSESQGAKVVDLEAYGMPPCLLVKADGATLYATRDLAAVYYRKATYDFYKCLYVVAYQQNLHFKQLFKVLELMEEPWAKDCEHVAFGMVSLEGVGALSTRKGNVVFLEEVIDKCIEKAKEIIQEKSPDLENADETARMIGTGAVVFSALINNRIKDISFSYDRVLNFDGETAPYVQYTFARANSVLEKGGEIGTPSFDGITDTEYALVKLLEGFPKVIKDAAEKYEPAMVTRHVVALAAQFNKFYIDCRILGEREGVKNFRLLLTKCTRDVIKIGLSLIGIETPEKM